MTAGATFQTSKEKAARHKAAYLAAGTKFSLARVYGVLKGNKAKLFQVEKDMVDEGLLEDDNKPKDPVPTPSSSNSITNTKDSNAAA